MEKILIECPHCGYQAKAKEELIGKKTKCPQCQRIFMIEKADIPIDTSQTKEKNKEQNAEEKILGTCPACNSEIKLYRNQLGMDIECPHCCETVVIESEKIIEYRCPFCGQVIKKGANVCKYCHKQINQLTEIFAWWKPVTLCGIGLASFWIFYKILTSKIFVEKLATSSFNFDNVAMIIAFILAIIIMQVLADKFKPVLYSEIPVLNPKVLFLISLLLLILGGWGTTYHPVLGCVIIVLTAFILTAEQVYIPLIGKAFPVFLEKCTVPANEAQASDETQIQTPEAIPIGNMEKDENDPVSLKSHCPYCGLVFDIQPEWIGQNADCPACGKEFIINEAEKNAF